MRPLQLTGAFIWSTGPHEYSLLLLLLLLLSLFFLSLHIGIRHYRNRGFWNLAISSFPIVRSILIPLAARPGPRTHGRSSIHHRHHQKKLPTAAHRPAGTYRSDPSLGHVWFSRLR